MGWSESTISDLRDLTGNRFHFSKCGRKSALRVCQGGCESLLYIFKTTCEEKVLLSRTVNIFSLFGWREFKIWFIWVYLFQNLAKDFFKKWLEVNQSVCFVTISNILGPVYTERHVNAAHFKAYPKNSGVTPKWVATPLERLVYWKFDPTLRLTLSVNGPLKILRWWGQ